MDVLLTTQTLSGADSDNGDAVRLEPSGASQITASLKCSSAATAVSDTLDVYVQTLIAGVWVDVIHFAQIPGVAGSGHEVAKICKGVAQAEFAVSAALGVGSVRHVFGKEWRARWVVVETDTAAFDFEVWLHGS